MVATHKDMVTEPVPLRAGKNGEVVCAKITLSKAPPLYVCAYYRPPGDTEGALDSLEEAIEELQPQLIKNPKASLVIGGDFNAPGIDWNNLTILPDCPRKGMCRRLVDILGLGNLKQLVLQPTRLKSILDLFCTNKPGLIKEVSLIPGFSDHDGIVIVDTFIKAEINSKPRHRIPLWSKADWDQIKKIAASFRDSYLKSCSSKCVDENWAAFTEHIKAIKDLVPTRLAPTKFNLPWLNRDIKKLCAKKRRAYTKAKNGSAHHRAKFKELQNKTRDALKKAHWGYVNNMLKDGLDKGDSKSFWRYIKAQKQDSQGVAPLRSGSKLLADSKSKAEALSAQFSSVFTRDTEETKDVRLEGPSYPHISSLKITETGVERLLANLNPSKASGPDQVPGRILKTLSNELAPVLTHIFRQSLSEGKVPRDWSTALITPVFKKGTRSDPANYRPVSLTCIACKLMEHIICTHVRGHLDLHGILTPSNHGFRARHSCETQLLLTSHDLICHRETSKQVDVAILDFSKAFDTVPHKRLLGKLEHYGISGDIHSWIQSFLVGRTQSVVVDGERSKDETVISGVPQGTVLGPLLFLLHINDLPSVVHPGTSCRLFADDCLLYRPINSREDQLALQGDLKKLEGWADSWGMRFNASKCYIMTIHRGQSRISHMYELCGTFLGSVTEEKYLGVLISHDLSWSPHIAKLATTAHQKLGFLIRNLRGCPNELKKTAYMTVVRSSLDYASTIWDPNLNKDKLALEKIQRKAARWITGNHQRVASVTNMLTSLGLESLEERRRASRLVLLYKILHEEVAVPPDELGLVRNQRATRGLATKDKLLVPSCKTTERSTHFVAKTVPQWNRLLESTTSADSVQAFKSRLSGVNPP